MDTRKQYEPPTVSVVGDVENVTAGVASKGGYTDFQYPAGTKRSAYRFYQKP